jgi:hypothetical protein
MLELYSQHSIFCVSVSECVRVCMCERERDKEGVYVCVGMHI